MNEVDLMYLTNNLDYKKIKDKKLEPELIEDIKFYKERIIKQNLDLLNGSSLKVAIVVSKWNSKITESLYKA